METGIDKKQIEAARQFFLGLSKDRVMLRFVVCLGILVVGWFGVVSPQADALAKARGTLESVRKQDKRASEAVFYTHQVESYEPFLFNSTEPSTLQDYVSRMVTASGAHIRGMVNKKTEAKGPFKIIELELTAYGTFSELADFVDRLERGDKVVRLEKCRLQATKTQIILDCVLNALVRPKGKVVAEAGEQGDPDAGLDDEAVKEAGSFRSSQPTPGDETTPTGSDTSVQQGSSP